MWCLCELCMCSFTDRMRLSVILNLQLNCLLYCFFACMDALMHFSYAMFSKKETVIFPLFFVCLQINLITRRHNQTATPPLFTRSFFNLIIMKMISLRVAIWHTKCVGIKLHLQIENFLFSPLLFRIGFQK